MSYINCGAFVNGQRPASKKALREALVATPDAVSFDGASFLGPQFSGSVAELPAGITLSVCGPDPYRSRKWFANVSLVNGTPKVK